MDPQISSLANELSNSIETILNPSSSQNDRQIAHKVRHLEILTEHLSQVFLAVYIFNS